MKVLIVEDERLTAKSLKLDLEDLGLEVFDPISRGEDAVRFALEQDPDLILMDINLSGDIDGIEAVRQIKQKKEIPIAYLSGYSTSETLERARSTGPIRFLQKPILFGLLKQMIQEISD